MDNSFLDLVMNKDTCKTLTICGSRRFRDLKERYQAYYTIQNNLVFMPINYMKIKNSVETYEGAPKINADIMCNIHDKKIDLSDAVIIVCGLDYEYYIGPSTLRELLYAYNTNKIILLTSLPPGNQKDKFYFNNNLTYPLYMPKIYMKDEDNKDGVN